MRVSALLREFNISLERLQSYESFLVDTDFKFNVVNQFVPDDIYLKVLEIHNNQPVVEPKKKEIVVFREGETYRFNGKVKWFFNKQTNGEYGFIEKKGLPDIYFSGDKYLYSDPRDLKPDDEVVVTVNKHDIDERRDEIKAIAVNSLFQEKNVKYLIFHFFSIFQKWNISQTDLILHKISELSEQLDKPLLSL